MFIWNVYLNYSSEMFIWNVHLQCSSSMFIWNIHVECLFECSSQLSNLTYLISSNNLIGLAYSNFFLYFFMLFHNISMSYSKLVHNNRLLAKARLSLAQLSPSLLLFFSLCPNPSKELPRFEALTALIP